MTDMKWPLYFMSSRGYTTCKSHFINENIESSTRHENFPLCSIILLYVSPEYGGGTGVHQPVISYARKFANVSRNLYVISREECNIHPRPVGISPLNGLLCVIFALYVEICLLRFPVSAKPIVMSVDCDQGARRGNFHGCRGSTR